MAAIKGMQVSIPGEQREQARFTKSCELRHRSDETNGAGILAGCKAQKGAHIQDM
jgi:hypothetical protein